MKKTDLYALSFAAMLAASMSTANAADLGGNCCADLEERVAELEATVAKKGNRKVSLTISGHVNKAIMVWDAPNVTVNPGPGAATGTITGIAPGTKSGTYLGIDNSNSSTRFGFSGSATINPEWKAGFSILIDVGSGARAQSVTQVNEEGDINGSTAFRNDFALRMRDANWWLESNRIGKVTVGRLTASGAQGTIDLGGIGVIASDAIGGLGGAFQIGAVGGTVSSFNNWTDNQGDINQRTDGVKYTSPTVQGFVMSATIGETARQGNITSVSPAAGVGIDGGRVLGVDLKYATEFNGVQFVAAIGFERGLDEQHTPANSLTKSWGGSLALLHTPTGLFLQTAYLRQDIEAANPAGLAPLVIVSNDANKWVVQAGVKRNWFGIGNTSLYGEYIRSNDWLDAHLASLPGAQLDSRVNTWGIGMVQNIDAAAMELYMGYRNHSFSALGAANANIEDFSTFVAGARIRF